MIVTLILGFLCISFNLIDFLRKNDLGLKLSFILIFLFLGLRYNYGNDYDTYIELFRRVNENKDLAFDQSMYLFYEPGWMLLNWLCTPIGFFGMTMVLAFVYCLIIYKLVKRNIPYQYYWLALFFIVFNPGFLLVHSTAMRQTVAILIVLLSIDFIHRKKIILFLLCILLAATFHYTSLTILVISPFLFYNRKINIIYASILFSVYLIFFVFGNSLAPYIGQLVSMFSERYEAYSDKGSANSGLGFVFYSTIFLITLAFDNLQETKTSLFFKFAIVYYMLMPFTLIIEMTARIGMYFSPSVIVVYPFIAKSFKSKAYKGIFLTVLMLFTIYQFFQFFYSDTYHDYFMEYHTFFSSPEWN